MRLSACIIARDEAQRLPACLASVRFCDQVVVVDSGSTDATVAIARAAGAEVVEQPWLGFSAQRNVALDHATGEWVLEIDADERLSPALQAEIEAFLERPPDGVDMAGLPLRDRFLGRPLGPSAKYPKYRHRLFRRGAYRHDEARTVHERLVPTGPVHPFAGDLEHELAGSWGEALRDAWAYVRLEAAQITAAPRPAAVAKGALVRPAAKLVYRLAVDGGWRDGWRGLARIGLDCGSDSLVWLLHGIEGGRSVSGRSGVPPGAHYGSWRLRHGSRRIVAVAFGDRAAQEAARWLSGAQGPEGDVALISDVRPAGPVRVRRLARPGPLGLVRALEAEDQLRTMDAVTPFGRRARLALRLVPGHLRGLEAA